MDHTRYRKVFVTGALGFVGRALMARYRALGAEVCGMDVRSDATESVVGGDVTRAEEWQEAINGSDLVIHTAAIVTNNVAPAEAWRVNVLGTRRVIDAAIKAGQARIASDILENLKSKYSHWPGSLAGAQEWQRLSTQLARKQQELEEASRKTTGRP